MSLTVHATIGALIGLTTKNPVLGFFAGVASHFIADAIPHGDEILGELYERKDYKSLLPAVALDFALTFLFLFSFLVVHRTPASPALTWSMIGAILPDLLNPMYKRKQLKALKPLMRLHEASHKLLGENFKITFFEGAVVQLIIWLLVWGQISNLLT
jgi:hypothetical protein